MKAWLKELSLAYAALRKFSKDKWLLNDLKYLTDFNHTGTLEVYHSIYNKYSPKRLQFSYSGVIARAQLAVLDFNSGVGLEQSKNKQGDLRYKHQFSKITQSWVVKIIHDRKEKTTYKDHILDEVNYLKKTSCTYDTPKLGSAPDYIGGIEKLLKATTTSNRRLRFKAME